MTFLFAGWLWLLVPWAALAVWCWRRRPEPRGVTARFLWGDRSATPSTFALRRRPPLWMVCLLGATLLGVFALAGAALRRRAARVLLLIDPAVALAAIADGRTLRDEMIDRAARSLPRDAQVEWRAAGEQAFEPSHFTARKTDLLVRAAIDQIAVGDYDAIVVLTDKPIRDPRVLVVAPANRPANVGIERLAIDAATSSPNGAQLMIRIANFGPARPAALHASGGGAVVTRSLQLSPGRQNAFVDLPVIADRVEVDLDVADDPLPIDNVATLVRTGAWPRLILIGDLPESATRFAGVYGTSRPASAASRDVLLTDRAADAVLPAICMDNPSVDVIGRPELSDHPVLKGVDFEFGSIPMRVAPLPLGEWTVIARIGSTPIVAVRASPARQVWIGWTPDPGALSSVVLLGNAVAWASGGATPEFASATPDAVGREWQRVEPAVDAVDASHGLYRDAAGRLAAVNVPAIAPGDARADAANLNATLRPVAVSIAAPIAILAAALVMCAAVLLRGQPRLDASRRTP